MELQNYTIAQLTDAHNEAISVHDIEGHEPVKKFKDKATAVARLEALATEGLEWVESDEGAPVLVHEAEVEAAAEDEETGDSVAVEPEPVKSEEKAPKAPSKPRTEYEDRLRIELRVSENPKRRGSAAHARFALYRDGMTVGEYLDACVALEGEKAKPRYRYITDLAWDEERAHITVWVDQLLRDQWNEGDNSLLIPYLPEGTKPQDMDA